MRHAYFYIMTLSYMTLKTKNPSFLNSCADKIVCMFKLVPFSHLSLARNDRQSVEKLRFLFDYLCYRYHSDTV